MRTESDILVAVLLRLIGLDIIALPMHDGLMVRRDNAATALKVMRKSPGNRRALRFRPR